jgi:inosine triphosphate pyrophosphatase
MDITFITGNPNKAKYVAQWLGRDVKHKKLNVDEIQSIDVREVTEHKARQAYSMLKSPVLVEDGSLVFCAMAPLPGPFVKWFIESSGLEQTCRMLDGFSDRSAIATLNYCLYDGREARFFEGQMRGTIAQHPRGDGGFGFDKIFIDDQYGVLRSEMDEAAYKETSYRYKAIAKLAKYLARVDNNQA